MYLTSPVMSAEHTRNSYYYIGDALRITLTGGKIHFSNEELSKLKNFVECEEFDYR